MAQGFKALKPNYNMQKKGKSTAQAKKTAQPKKGGKWFGLPAWLSCSYPEMQSASIDESDLCALTATYIRTYKHG